MTGQHEPLWKPEEKSGAPEVYMKGRSCQKRYKFIALAFYA